jgi:mevalonate kinase
LKHFWSPGKLMISGEYMVINGAKSLAVPTVLGQDLYFSFDSNRAGHTVQWASYIHGDIIWYSNQFNLEKNWEAAQQPQSERTAFIRSLLLAIAHYKPDFFKEKGTYTFKTVLEFDPGWGLGSSSSLIGNLALLTDIQPFDLLFMSTLNQGSGYDVAVSYLSRPVVYQIENDTYHWATPISLEWDAFDQRCILVYLNRKQDSNQEIRKFKRKGEKKNQEEVIKSITEITEKLTETKEYNSFCSLLQQHEQMMSDILQTPCIKEELFPDFKGVIKSLGAWGGDFILACPEEDYETAEQYFRAKGYDTLMNFGKMIEYKWE